MASKSGMEKRRNRPCLEKLEGRIVLSTYRVSSAAQLQADVADLANSTGPNTIVLKTGVLYSLSQSLQIQNAGNLTIEAVPGKGNVTLTSNVVDRVLEIDGGNVTLNNLNIIGGGSVAQGAGILAQNAAVTLQNTKVVSNVATQAGGGIAIYGGSLVARSSSIDNNRASNPSSAYGGGIFAVNSAVTLTNTTVSENSVYSADTSAYGGAVSGSGGGIYTQGGTLTISHGTVSGDHVYGITTGMSASTSGGAITSVLTTARLSNTVLQYNGLNNVSNGTFAIEGGVFMTNGGSLTVVNGQLSKNSPGSWKSFSQTNGALVTIVNSTLDNTRIKGTYTF
ncbi:MAG: hypothetical protein ACLP7Q_15910 [Isosphaeraceae bacterium]